MSAPPESADGRRRHGRRASSAHTALWWCRNVPSTSLRLAGRGMLRPACASIHSTAANAAGTLSKRRRKAPTCTRRPTASTSCDDDAEDALAAGEIAEPERLEAARPEPCLGRVRGHLAVAVLRPFSRHVEAPVAVKPDEVAAGQDHVGSPDDVDRPAASVRVQADPAAGEPAGEGRAEVGRVDGQRELVLGEAPVHGAQPGAGAEHADVVVGVDVDVVEMRQVEREPAVARHRPAEGRGGGAAHGDRDVPVPGPAQRRRDLGHGGGQEDEVGQGARQAPREQPARDRRSGRGRLLRAASRR